MTKQYVWWRKPNGKLTIQHDDEAVPRELLNHIGVDAKPNDEGGIEWSSLNFHRYETALRPYLFVRDSNGRELNNHDAWTIVQGALYTSIRETGGKCAIPPDLVIELANKSAAAFFRKRQIPYTLVTSLSIASLPAKRIRIRDCEISALQKRERFYRLPDKASSAFAQHKHKVHLTQSRYLPVRIHTTGRSYHEAVSKALDVLNQVRGLWTLFATYGQWSFGFGFGRTKPIGVIELGPIHTLHHRDGKPVEDVYWYEPDYIEDQELFIPKTSWSKIDNGRQWAIHKIARLPYQNDLESLITRYSVALGHANLSVAFLQLWSILEKISGTIGGPYSETIKRISWIFNDRLLAREMLKSLQIRRNQFVHSPETDLEHDQLVYMVKLFVEPHLLRLIRNDFRVSSLEEYSSFLSLPTSVSELDKRVQQFSRAARMRRRWEKAK